MGKHGANRFKGRWASEPAVSTKVAKSTALPRRQTTNSSFAAIRQKRAVVKNEVLGKKVIGVAKADGEKAVKNAMKDRGQKLFADFKQLNRSARFEDARLG